ncbi:MAG: ATP:cob(I)alamin adenosyltransferase, partial [Tepidisphaeraceae bacterium]
MKIYTRTGDDGTTGLIGGKRVPKHDLRIECYGTVDELNAAIGLAATGAADELLASLRRVQNELFVIGSHLAND